MSVVVAFKLFLVSIFLSSVSALGAQEKGWLNINLFEVQGPLMNVVVRVDNRQFSTDSNGSITIHLDPGSYLAEVVDYKKNIEINVVEGGTTKVTFHRIRSEEKPEVFEPKIKQKVIEDSTLLQLLKGKVVSLGDSKAVVNASVEIPGSSYKTTTSDGGTFDLKVPKGSWTLMIRADGFKTLVQYDVKVHQRKSTLPPFKLVPKGIEMEEFVVVSPKSKGSISSLLNLRKEHKSVADVMGSEQISRSGDGDAGGSLRRVTGISLVDGKYVYVRGLGERYSSTMLNGVSVPSPDPARRVVPLDLFPSGIIESMVIQKSYSADLPGEFGGGAIQINTKSLPESSYFKINLSLNAGSDGESFSPAIDKLGINSLSPLLVL